MSRIPGITLFLFGLLELAPARAENGRSFGANVRGWPGSGALGRSGTSTRLGLRIIGPQNGGFSRNISRFGGYVAKTRVGGWLLERQARLAARPETTRRPLSVRLANRIFGPPGSRANIQAREISAAAQSRRTAKSGRSAEPQAASQRPSYRAHESPFERLFDRARSGGIRDHLRSTRNPGNEPQKKRRSVFTFAYDPAIDVPISVDPHHSQMFHVDPFAHHSFGGVHH